MRRLYDSILSMSEKDYAFEVHRILDKKKTTISCVISAYNEEPRIKTVLDVVTSFPIFDEVIVVNDGSQDNTLKVLQKYAKNCPNLKIIDQQPNQGKTQGIINGVKASKGELTCLVDADLTGLRYEYLYKMIYFVLTGDFDMTILDRAGDRMGPLGWSQSWVIRFIGGERAFWRKDFEKIVFEKGQRYAIEQVINKYYVENGLHVRTIYCPDLIGAYQFKKKGFREALKSYMKMIEEIYKHSKVKGFYVQVESIVEDRLERLYDISENTDSKATKKITLGAILVAGLLTSVASFIWLNVKNNAKKIRGE